MLVQKQPLPKTTIFIPGQKNIRLEIAELIPATKNKGQIIRINFDITATETQDKPHPLLKVRATATGHQMKTEAFASSPLELL